VDSKYEGVANIVQSVVEVLCYNGMFDEENLSRQMLRLYQELLVSLVLYQRLLKSNEEGGREMRKHIEENSDLLLLTGEPTNSTKNYIRGSFESLVVLSLADFLEGGRNELILKRIEEYRQHSSTYQELFNRRASLLLKLLNQSLP